MATVTDATTGEEVEVVQVEAAAAIASINEVNSEFPKTAAKDIEAAMAAAAQHALEAGVSDPEKIRGAMLAARESAKLALRMQMRDEQTQRDAAQQG